MKVLFCAGFAPIVSDLDASVAFYGSTLGIPGMHRDADNPDYVATNDLDGLKHLGLWKLSDAAEACFGTNEWPSDVPVPQGTIEFDVEDVHVITANDVKITKEAGGYKVQASYEATAPYISNVYLLVVFDKTVVVK